MHKFLSGWGRGVAALAIVATLCVPVEAKPSLEDDGWIRRQPVVKFFKRLAIQVCGDLLTDPKP